MTVERLNAKRRRLWVSLAKKEVGKAQKARNFNQKERLASRKRAAAQCMRVVSRHLSRLRLLLLERNLI